MEGGRSLSEMYQSCRKLLLVAREALETLEGFDYSLCSIDNKNNNVEPELQLSIKRDLERTRSLCAQMDRLWHSIASNPQRHLWRRKVEQVVEEVDSLKDSLDKHLLRNQKRMLEAKERAELLERASMNSTHILRIFDDEAQAMQSVNHSSLMLDEAYATGVAVLSRYAEQRDHLKRAHRKALDILNNVGLSNSVLKHIERRHRVDKIVVYVGMLLTAFVVFVFWRWTH